MNILVMAGHTLSGVGTGAVGHINESSETRIFAPLLVNHLKNGGANVTYIKLDRAVTSSYLDEQVRLANNSGKFDLVIQIHFNAGSKDPNSNTTGCEVYAYDNNGKKYAERICSKVSSLLTNRGAKINQDLYWLRNTRDLAILIEVCFVDDKDDIRVYNSNKDKIAKLIAEGILNKSISEPTTPTPSEEMYRVRKTWQDAKSQKGAYSSLENAKRECDKHSGYSVFNNKGAKVYPNTVPSAKPPYKNGDYDCKAKVVRTNGTGLNVRSSRSASSTKLGNIKEGTIITVNYCKDNWFSTYHLGKLGFISGDYIELI